MNILEHNILTIMEGHTSWQIEAIIAELQIMADRKYMEEESLTI